MSVKYIPVQWNRNKWLYDAVMLAGVFAFLWIFLKWTPDATGHDRPVSPQTHNARAFGWSNCNAVRATHVGLGAGLEIHQCMSELANINDHQGEGIIRQC